jgi:putative membrane protein
MLFLLALVALYVLGLRYARRHHVAVEDGGVTRRHILAFFSAIVLMAITLLTPIDTIAHSQLFSVHMVRLVLLITLCSPLILYGSPAGMVRPLVQLPVIGFVLRLLTRPLVASLLFNILFLLWHAPRILHSTFDNNVLYHTLVLSIFVASLLNWWPLLGSVRELRPMSYPIQMLYAFFDGQPVDIFAFILVFTGVTVYPYYAVPAQLGLSTFADQAIGGALLLIPGLVDLVVMTPLFFRWLGQIENQTKQTDQERAEEEYEIEYEEDEVEA